MSQFLQFAFSGLTIGAIYALVALGFNIIYSASNVMNFAQGEFVMIGGMATFVLHTAGIPLVPAALLAIIIAAVVGFLLYRLAIRPARDASPVTLIIITIGASIFIRGDFFPAHLDAASLAYFMHSFSETEKITYRGEVDDGAMNSLFPRALN